MHEGKAKTRKRVADGASTEPPRPSQRLRPSTRNGIARGESRESSCVESSEPEYAGESIDPSIANPPDEIVAFPAPPAASLDRPATPLSIFEEHSSSYVEQQLSIVQGASHQREEVEKEHDVRAAEVPCGLRGRRKVSDRFADIFKFARKDNIPPAAPTPKHRLDNLLAKLYFEFTEDEVDVLQRAYHCDICNDSNTTCHQVRAVYDAFNLAWSIEAGGKDGLLTMSDLEVFVSKCELGEEFLNRLKMVMLHILHLDPDAQVTSKQFMITFAYALQSLQPDDRLLFNRVLGRMFGIEMTKQRYRWNKFFVAVLASNFAALTDCLCYTERRFGPSSLLTSVLSAIRGGKRKLDVMEAESSKKKSSLPVFKILSDATWLPPGYTDFRDFQRYLRCLWLPNLIAGLVYIFGSGMLAVSSAEVMCPLVLYSVLGLIYSTTAGFEHRGLVMRRKYALAGESMDEDFRATFAFRSHTPEGHLVEKITTISEVCEVGRWQAKCETLSMIVGMVHGLTPALHRAYFQSHGAAGGGGSGGGVLLGGVGSMFGQLWWMLTGAAGLTVEALLTSVVTLPSAALSGYLIYRLMLMTADIFYNDLAFMYKLKLFKACTTPAYYLVYKRKWGKAVESDPRLQSPWSSGFMDFMSLQEERDLVLWCRVRQLLIDSSGGFKSIQREVVLTYILLIQLLLTIILIAKHYESLFLHRSSPPQSSLPSISLVDLWILLDCSVFSTVLCVIMYNKLVIYDMRRRDIKLLHDEYYRASLLMRTVGPSEHMPDPAFAAAAAAGGFADMGGGGGGGGGGVRRTSSSATESSAAPHDPMSRLPSCASYQSVASAVSGAGGAGDALSLAAAMALQVQQGAGGAGGGGAHGNNGVAWSSRRGRPRKSSVTGHSASAVMWPGIAGGYLNGAGGVVGGGVGGGGAAGGGGGMPHRVSDVQLLLEQTARYVQHFEKPPTVLGYPVSWEVLRYATLSMVGAIITGLQGTGALVKIMRMTSK